MQETAHYKELPSGEFRIRLSSWDTNKTEILSAEEWNETQRRWIKMGVVIRENPDM